MAERPILFSAPMVRAILAGTKTVTRRVVRIPEIVRAEPDAAEPSAELAGYTTIQCRDDGAWRAWMTEYPEEGSVTIACPYGLQRDRLWVRETWAAYHEHASEVGIKRALQESKERLPWAGIIFAASANGGHQEAHRVDGRWRPSIHLPRWASRITLEVVSVRVEPLQEITEEDAKAEGCTARSYRDGRGHESALLDFHRLWDSINGTRPGCSWSDNPWVWRVEFKRVEQEASHG